jgi:hypothetical protein
MYCKLFIILIVFLLGLYFITRENIYEGFNTHHKKQEAIKRCPNLLIQKGKEFFLYNSKLAPVPGVNPISFNNLEEYVEFTDWQRGQGIRCPVMFLQQTYDTQGKAVYKARPSPTDLQGGLPDLQPGPFPLGQGQGQDQGGSGTNQPAALLIDASKDNNPPYNINSYPGFDEKNQNIGRDTPLDKMFNENIGGISPNPMDENWGGNTYTQDLIDAGYYKGDEVIKQTVNSN